MLSDQLDALGVKPSVDRLVAATRARDAEAARSGATVLIASVERWLRGTL